MEVIIIFIPLMDCLKQFPFTGCKFACHQCPQVTCILDKKCNTRSALHMTTVGIRASIAKQCNQ